MKRLRNKQIGMVKIQGIKWTVWVVSPDSEYLLDENKSRCQAMTIPDTQKVYIARNLSEDRMRVALAHELGVHVVHDEVNYPISDDESHASAVEYAMRDLLNQRPMDMIDKYFKRKS